jgi:hypothetical protein
VDKTSRRQKAKKPESYKEDSFLYHQSDEIVNRFLLFSGLLVKTNFEPILQLNGASALWPGQLKESLNKARLTLAPQHFAIVI